MTTIDQIGRLVLDFHRCAMLPLRDGAADTGHADDMAAIGTGAVPAPDPTAERDADEFDAFRARVPGTHFDSGLAGAVLHSTADVVSSAPELARLTLNIAATHHDSRVAGSRLVYGGHTIGLAFAQATRLLPNIATVLGWESCDHLGPVHEGNTLYSELHVDDAVPLPENRGGVLKLRSLVYAVDHDGADRQVLDALQDAEVDGLARLGGEFLHHRAGLLAHVQGSDDRQAHLDQRRPGDVGAGERLLLDETVVGEHREQSVCRRVGNTEVLAGVGEPHPGLLTEQKKQKKSVVDRRYGIGGSGFALRS